jgi:hypothetical protein
LCTYGVKIKECVTKLMDFKKLCRFDVDIIAQKGKNLCTYGVKIKECVTKLMDFKKLCRFDVDM